MIQSSSNTSIILASQSPFRAELMARLGVDFIQISANVDESAYTSESPQALTQRLATLKAQSVLKHCLVKNADKPGNNQFIVIGSDQVACHNEKILGKPHTRENAIKQLTAFSENQVDFFTAVSVLSTDKTYQHLDKTSVHFKKLSRQNIENYVDHEDVLNCAGSFKSEGLGICLFNRIENQDPTALIGLPMIWVADRLQKLGVNLP